MSGTALAVVYSEGAASPREIAARMPVGSDLVWLIDRHDSAASRLKPILRLLGTVIEFEIFDRSVELDDWWRKADIAGITTFSDKMVRVSAIIAAKLSLPYHTVSCAEMLTDKSKQRRRLERAGVDSVMFEPVMSAKHLIAAAGRIGLPAVAKPIIGLGSRYSFLLETSETILKVLDVIPTDIWNTGLILEEYIAGRGTDAGTGLADYLSVETLSSGGTHEVVGLVGRLPLAYPFRERGGIFPSGSSDDDIRDISRLAQQALTALEVETGICHTEVKLTADGPRIIEVNGRLGGHVEWLLTRSGGVSLVEAQLQLALGRSPALTAWEPAGISFRHLVPAPLIVGTVKTVSGLAEVRATPGVEQVQARVKPGRRCDWREGTDSCLAQVAGWVESFRALHDCISAVEELLSVTIDVQAS